MSCLVLKERRVFLSEAYAALLSSCTPIDLFC